MTNIIAPQTQVQAAPISINTPTGAAAVSGAVLTADRTGNFNSAYFFDGVDDYIEKIYVYNYL